MNNQGQRAAAHIVRAAKKHKGISIMRPHLSGVWIVKVDEKGKLQLEGRAASNYPPNTTIPKLSRTDLLALLNEAVRLNAGGTKPVHQAAPPQIIMAA